jgi:hypothetical protein
MALPSVSQGIAITREWDEIHGLSETETAFGSLEELYAFCLGLENPTLIERIVLDGTDKNGRPVSLTFQFQSISTPEDS